ncbi:MAG: hypothetical protein SAJ37_06865 [Oscillatoria sp. PMC 1068.18]|nr:hypothetical protein [Oscillatoria sp. PMC 1076.18]MEC4988453.1 hypothetical protein [Oscillatoria sp. PMC 1068.18]
MNPPFFLKNLPRPVRILFRPMLFISLSLHIVLLMLPVPSDSKKAKIEPLEPEKEEEVKITKLPPKTSPSPTPKASPQASISPSPTPKPSPSVAQPKPTPQQIANQLLNPPKLTSTPTPIPTSTPQTKPTSTPTPTPTSTPQIKPTSTPTPASTPTPTPTQTPSSTPSQTLEDFLREFPTYQQAQPGSGEILRPEFDQSAYIYNTNDKLEQVTNAFKSNLLPAKDYNAQLITEENNFQVLEVSKGKITQYLHLISQGEKVAFVLLEKAYSLDKIKTAKTGEVDFNQTAFIVIIAQLEKQYEEGTTPVDRSLLSSEFKDSNKFDYRVMTGASFLNPPTKEQLINDLRNLFQQESFNFEEVGSYGGGSLFKVSRETFEIYVVFAPAGDRTAIIIAEEDPR